MLILSKNKKKYIIFFINNQLYIFKRTLIFEIHLMNCTHIVGLFYRGNKETI